MPESMSLERRNLLAALGAKLELTPASQGMKGAIAKANELKESIPGSVILGQFVNPSNPLAHERTTAQEIWRDTDGAVDVFVGGVGTGGTVSGTGRALKKHKSSVQVVAVEPAGSPVLTEGRSGSHKIQGIGAGFVPQTYDASVIDKVIPVADEDAAAASRLSRRRMTPRSSTRSSPSRTKTPPQPPGCSLRRKAFSWASPREPLSSPPYRSPARKAMPAR